MINIAICDDEQVDLNSLKIIVNDFFKQTQLEYAVYLYNKGNDLIKSNIPFDLVFLDIEIGNENGINIARALNQHSLSYKLILISNFSEYLREGYKVKADRFFTKPINLIEFNLEMKDILEDYLLNSNFILDEKISRNKIYVKDILYIEILARKTYLHTKQKTYETTYPLSYWKNLLLDFHFILSHKSFLVNAQNITDYTVHSIILTNNERIPLSRFYKQKFVEKYLWFINRNL